MATFFHFYSVTLYREAKKAVWQESMKTGKQDRAQKGRTSQGEITRVLR